MTIAVAFYTVVMYSIPATGDDMKSTMRQHYRPTPDRLPRWLRRVWIWF
jgi:hypothetical protein